MFGWAVEPDWPAAAGSGLPSGGSHRVDRLASGGPFEDRWDEEAEAEP